MRRTCAGVIVQFDGSIYVRKEDIERIYKRKTGKNIDIKLGGKAWDNELQAYLYPIGKNKSEVFFDLHDLMIAIPFNEDEKFKFWFFDAFMREVFYEFEIASRIRFAGQMMDIAKEGE